MNCHHCKKEFPQNEVVISIEARIVKGKEACYVNNLEPLRFHQKCFWEVAGHEYAPTEKMPYEKEKYHQIPITPGQYTQDDMRAIYGETSNVHKVRERSYKAGNIK